MVMVGVMMIWMILIITIVIWMKMMMMIFQPQLDLISDKICVAFTLGWEPRHFGLKVFLFYRHHFLHHPDFFDLHNSIILSQSSAEKLSQILVF